MNTFAKMIERMEDFVLTGMGIPFTPWTIVNGEKLVPLLDRIRENLPAEIQNAQRILDRRDELLNESQQKANQLMQDAKKQAEFMLSESELLRAVHAEADRIKQQITLELDAMRKKAYEEAEAVKGQAYEEARLVREGADQYAEAILGNLDRSLMEFQTVVRNGQKYLKQARATAAQQGYPGAKPQGYYDPAYTGAQQEAQQPLGQTSQQASSYAQDFLKQTTLTSL